MHEERAQGGRQGRWHVSVQGAAVAQQEAVADTVRASVTKRRERSFRQAIERFDTRGTEPSAVHPRIRQAEREAMESQRADLLTELAEYERLKAAGLNECCTVSRSRTQERE